MEKNEPFDHELFKAMQESERTKEADWEELKKKLDSYAPEAESKDIHDQIIANQLTGMSLEEAIYQTGYSAGVEFEKKRAVQGAAWVKGQYDRLYEQLKAQPERKIACWVDYQWGLRDEPKEILRDICSIMGRFMGFNARGIGYGGAELFIGEENERAEFIEECNRLNVQWLDEQPLTQKLGSIEDGSANINFEQQAYALYQQYCNDKGIVYHLMDAANFCLGYMAAKNNR